MCDAHECDCSITIESAEEFKQSFGVPRGDVVFPLEVTDEMLGVLLEFPTRNS